MSIINCLTIALIIPSICSSDVPFYRFDYEYVKEYDAYYKFFETEVSQPEAVELCQMEGSQLWSPNTDEERRFIIGQIVKENIDVWSGHYRFGAQTSFYTIDGSNLTNLTMTNEMDHGNKSNCVNLCEEKLQNDMSCEYKLRFICKKKVYHSEKNEECENYDKDYVLSESMASCYKLHTSRANWTTSFNNCRAENASLAIVNSKVEATVLMETFHDYPTNSLQNNFLKGFVYLGFSNHLMPEIYTTLMGEPLLRSGYSKWAANEPTPGHSMCGAMSREGFFHNIDCSIKAMYFCEKNIFKKIIYY